MHPTTVLAREHQVLIRFLDTFGAMMDQTVREGRARADDLEDALTFIEEYGDAYHHCKEEDWLFDRLKRVCSHWGARPLAVLLEEHELEREYLRTMRDLAPDAIAGDPRALKSLSRLSSTYVERLMIHIEKEDRILFPLLDELLPEAEQRLILEGFRRVDRELKPRSPGELLLIADRLGRRYKRHASSP